MNWSEVYNYLRWKDADGFHKQHLNARALNFFRAHSNYRTIANDYRTLLTILNPLLVQPCTMHYKNNHPVGNMLNTMLSLDTQTPRLIIHQITRDINASFLALDGLDLTRHQVNSDRTAALSLTATRYDRFRVLRKDNCVLIITNKKVIESVEYMRKIYALLPRWFAVKENTQDIFMSLVEQTPDNLFIKLAEYYNTQTTVSPEQLIQTFETIAKQTVLATRREIQARLDRITQNLEEKYNEIHRLYQKEKEYQEQLLVQNKDEVIEAGLELIDYLNKRPGIEIIEINPDGTILLNIQSALTFYDPTPVKRLISREDDEHLKRFLQDVFIDNKYQIQIGTAARMFLNVASNDRGITIDTDLTIPENTIWNPHLWHYNCWGANRSEIIKALQNQQYIAAVEQAYAATCSINVLDGPVWSRFCESLYRAFRGSFHSDLGGAHSKCLKDMTTGELITLTQYKERIDAQ